MTVKLEDLPKSVREQIQKKTGIKTPRAFSAKKPKQQNKATRSNTAPRGRLTHSKKRRTLQQNGRRHFLIG